MVGRRRGFTLIELVVAAALLSVLLTMLYQLLVPTIKEVKKSEADVDTQRAVAMALDRLHSEAAYSSPLSTTIIDSPPGVCYLSAAPPSHRGMPVLTSDRYQLLGVNTRPLGWAKFVIWYHHAEDRTLNRKELPYPEADTYSLAKIAPDQLRELIDSTRYPDQPMAHGIEEVVFDMSRPPLLVIDLTAVEQGIHDQKETRLVFTTTMRN